MAATWIIFLPFVIAIFAAVMTYRSKGSAGRQVTEPSCGSCGYCVRGLETFTCPECGSDLREVGILTPGQRKPLSRGMRLLLWTIAIAPPAIILTSLLGNMITPYQVTTTRQRVIFSHIPHTNFVVRVIQEGKQTRTGRRYTVQQTPAPPQEMRLTLESKNSSNILSVKLGDGSHRFNDANGAAKSGAGPFDANVIADWLKAHSYTTKEVDEVAGYMMKAIDDMANPATTQPFMHFRSADNHPRVVAHPTNLPWTVATPTPLARFIPFTIPAAIWLVGLPFVLRRPRVQSAGDANQA